MSGHNRKNILCGGVGETSFLAIDSSKLKVTIIGGGRAGFIKARTFLKRGAAVKVVSRDFHEGFSEFIANERLELVCREYDVEFIQKCHLVIIATDDCKLNETVMKDCDECCKMYINCAQPEKGMGAIAAVRETKSMTMCLTCKDKSPRTSVFLLEKMKKELEAYDEYVNYATALREKNIYNESKNSMMEFVSSDDFYFFYTKGCGDAVIKMFYGGDEIET